MTLIYEKTNTRNDWLVRKDGESIDLALVDSIRESEGWTWKKSIQQVVDDDELNFSRIDIEILLLALQVMIRWYEGGDLLPLGKYRLNSGYLERIHDES